MGEAKNAFYIGLLFGSVVATIIMFITFDRYSPVMRECARQHNVYACHMVAVPSEKEVKP